MSGPDRVDEAADRTAQRRPDRIGDNDGGSSSARALLALQRTAGNTAVRSVIQRSAPDPAEEQANRATRTAVSVAAPVMARQVAGGGGGGAAGAPAMAPPPTAISTGQASTEVQAPKTSPSVQGPTTDQVLQGPKAGGGGAGGGEGGSGAQTGPGDTTTTRPMLRRGSRGADVTVCQQKLNAHGADPALADDGAFGPLTHQAVVSFQTSKGLAPDGIVGPLTWGELDKTPGGGGGGGGGGVEPPVDEERRRARAQVTIAINDHGVSAARPQAQQYMDEIFESLTTAQLVVMAGKTVTLHVIPTDKKLTDLDEFSSLRGTQTFDGRLWDDVRGIHYDRSSTQSDIAVGAEDLGAPSATVTSGYGPGFVAAHEAGHALKARSLTPEQLTALETIYTARKAAHPIERTTPASDPVQAFWLEPGWYTAANSHEYIASSVAAWFGHPYNTNATVVAKYTRDWLRVNDAPMHAFLTTLYGAA